MKYREFTAGRLIAGYVRDALEDAKFKGYNLEYRESKGWLVSEFTVKGDDEAIQALDRYIDEISKDDH